MPYRRRQSEAAKSLYLSGNRMIFPPFRRSPRQQIIASLYGTIVAQARAPAFYRVYGVPDTVNGRLEMVILHVVLFLRRLEGEGAQMRALGQALFDHFCRDMDASIREMGVGDLAVPRKMRSIGEAFYRRQAAYRSALAATDDAVLAQALEQHVFTGAARAEAASRLASYMREAVRRLARQDRDRFGRAELSFPEPVTWERQPQ